MTPSTHKILYGFGGDKHAAIAYCLWVSILYPQFAPEYEEYARVIKNYEPQSY